MELRNAKEKITKKDSEVAKICTQGLRGLSQKIPIKDVGKDPIKNLSLTLFVWYRLGATKIFGVRGFSRSAILTETTAASTF